MKMSKKEKKREAIVQKSTLQKNSMLTFHMYLSSIMGIIPF